MTAIEQVLKKHPIMTEYMLIKFSCPNVYKVGIEPEWCGSRKKIGKTCKECWNQPAAIL